MADWFGEWDGDASDTLRGLCTLADVKQRLGIPDSTAEDALLARIIYGVGAMIQRACSRELIVPLADQTEYGTGRCEQLRVNRYPITAILSIKESWDGLWDQAAALVAGTDYRMDAAHGILVRLTGSWLPQYQSIQVIYRGGYCAAGETPASNEFALPDDLREAAIEQACFLYKRRHDIGLSAVSFDGGSIQKMASMDLLPLVKAVCQNHRRLLL